MLFRQIVDDRLAQYAYLVGCQRTGQAILVDPERDVDRYLEAARSEGVRITAVTETHIHADFLSGARELAARDPGIRVYLSDEGDADWKYLWPDRDGRAWTPLRHGDVLLVGNVELRVRFTPGHTPEHVAFEIVDRGGGADAPMALLSGDFVFVGDLGRPDLLETAAGVAGAREPSARRLFASARDFVTLPEWLQVWPGHGAGSACGKALGAVPSSTVGYERRFSPALAAAAAGERAFVDFILAGQPEPPVYFARMKRLNKEGPPVLGELPRPARLAAAELARWLGRDDAVVLDTRRDRAAFFARHARGALFAPFNRTFPTIAGSYVEPEQKIVLVVDETELDESVRCLVRVGLDRVAGWAPPAILAQLDGEDVRAVPRLDFADGFDAALGEPDVAVLDVRSAAEFEAGHVPGALHAAHTRLAAELDALPRERPLLVHCQTGSRASSAASYLARRGFDVRYVDGELAAWMAAPAR
ncbi:MAG TPA: rhodanese-like domain-containing protein [Thermoanaerobaculia bacterium]